jgi:hypothetical protein
VILGPVGADPAVGPPIRLTRLQRHNLVRRFNAESRYQRRLYKHQLQREWDSEIAPAFDQENDRPNEEAMMNEEIAFDGFMCERLNRFDEDIALKKESFLDDICCVSLPRRLFPNGVSEERSTDTGPDAFLLRRTQELWAGLRRVYFGEVEDPSDSDEEFNHGVWHHESRSDGRSRKKPRTRDSVREFKQEITDLRARIRRQDPPVPDDLNLPLRPLRFRDAEDEDGPPALNTTPVFGPASFSDAAVFDSSLPGDDSSGEIDGDSTENGEQRQDIQRNGEQRRSTKIARELPFCQVHSCRPGKLVRHEATPHGLELGVRLLSIAPEVEFPQFSTDYDKYQAAVAIQPRPDEETKRGSKNGELRHGRKKPLNDQFSKLVNPVDDFMDAEFGDFREMDHAI